MEQSNYLVDSMAQVEQSAQTANFILTYYDKTSSGYLDTENIHTIQAELYRMIGRSPPPKQAAVDLQTIMDLDKDRRVGFEDINSGLLRRVIDPSNYSSTKGTQNANLNQNIYTSKFSSQTEYTFKG